MADVFLVFSDPKGEVFTVYTHQGKKKLQKTSKETLNQDCKNKQSPKIKYIYIYILIIIHFIHDDHYYYED